MARFFYDGKQVFKCYLFEIDESIDTGINSIKDFLELDLGIDIKLITFILEGEVFKVQKLDI